MQMRRHDDASLALPGGALERAVLEAVWDLDEPSAREVHDRVGAPRGLAYTTIAKVLDRLRVKKLCRRRREGRIWLFAPAVARNEVERATALASVSRLLGDNPASALTALVEAVESVEPDLLDELARVVASRRKVRRES